MLERSHVARGGAHFPGGSQTDFYKKAVDDYFGTGTFGKFEVLTKDASLTNRQVLSIWHMVEDSGRFAEVELKVEPMHELTREDQKYKDTVQESRAGIRRSLARLDFAPGQEGAAAGETGGLKNRVVNELKDVFVKICQTPDCGPNVPPKPDSNTSAGQGQLQQGDLPGAKESFNAAIRENPQNQAALAGRAQANYMMGDYASAAKDAQAALDLNPGDQRAFATLKLSENRVQAGAGVPASAEGAAGLGSTLGGFVDQASGAGRSARAALSRPEAGKSAALVKMAEKALRMGDYETARSLAGRAAELNPQNAQAHFYRSVASANLRDYANAFSASGAGLKLAPKNPALLNAKAFALNRLGQYKDALAAADAALQVNPKDAAALANRAYALGGLGDRSAMLENLRAAAAIDPRFKSSLESALQMPSDSDLLFLFPGETRPTTGPGPSAQGPVPDSGSGRRFWILVLAVLGALLAVGLFVYATGGARSAQTAAGRSGTDRSASAPGACRQPRADGPIAQASGLLQDKYEIVRQIGGGGMGVVFEGLDRSLNRKVAVKKMRDEIRLDRKERDRFLVEARTVAALHHANIVDIYAVVEADDDIYLVFEFISGPTLFDLIAKKGPVSLAHAVPVFQGIAAALDFAHSHGVIHRDLKPSNVMVDDEGYVKVMDFGVARIAKDAAGKFSMTNTVMGTPPYMAPEAETGVVRKESDVYSMAVCLYEALTGRQPFAGAGSGMLLNKMNMAFVPATKLVPGLPEGVDAVFSRAFCADPDKRYAGAGEMMKAVEALSSKSGVKRA
ncbi:MAG: protein kinase [Elusimicrobia bacterium]|nr:protein kinase [Elusimicrobiota bacterium]